MAPPNIYTCPTCIVIDLELHILVLCDDIEDGQTSGTFYSFYDTIANFIGTDAVRTPGHKKGKKSQHITIQTPVVTYFSATKTSSPKTAFVSSVIGEGISSAFGAAVTAIVTGSSQGLAAVPGLAAGAITKKAIDELTFAVKDRWLSHYPPVDATVTALLGSMKNQQIKLENAMASEFASGMVQGVKHRVVVSPSCHYYWISRGVGSLYALAAAAELKSRPDHHNHSPTVGDPIPNSTSTQKGSIVFNPWATQTAFFGALDAQYQDDKEFHGIQTFDQKPAQVKHYINLNDPYVVRMQVGGEVGVAGTHSNLGGLKLMERTIDYQSVRGRNHLSFYWTNKLLRSISGFDFTKGIDITEKGDTDAGKRAEEVYIKAKRTASKTARANKDITYLRTANPSNVEAKYLESAGVSKSDLAEIEAFEELYLWFSLRTVIGEYALVNSGQEYNSFYLDTSKGKYSGWRLFSPELKTKIP
ncbi:MAG: hypothetical protein U0324_36990 [Polyangiales bacterium]